ncbi:T-cell leukemia homeobox protein 3-like isoform X2 [Xenia sp. Carnegie-2017]|uniref:T-cell leukemia homeobox protein 3-like isoform X2 n=1 Tax=Xenia sp. Carnegie-2017 TaxID=2897299 RepID=UPI001F0371AC|nr:T-cell leukemia homeobox protein 3-like isoform X2 [Xenia sp. Carnegie-2017]
MSYTNFSIAVLMGEIDKKPEERSFTTNNRRSLKIKDNKLALHTEEVLTSNARVAAKDNDGLRGKRDIDDECMESTQRKRTSFSRLQQRMLEARFQRSPYLTIQERNTLANFLELNSRQVKVWFQNRRNKWKRENRGQLLLQPSMEMFQYASKTTTSPPYLIDNYFSCASIQNPFTHLYYNNHE